ncbi:F-box/RNI/FBD-like domain protein [Medicago truncatula]|uniref:F-box/RNI/FBD-like domain protein n=1 Tax=Medicago truncatula TaxID=3880 RepID=A0A072UA00_MEDTR|nr:F-box/RNI/FBD-like domain protein [Medicago truncatula]
MPGRVTLPRSIFSCRTLVSLHLKGLKVNDISHGVVDFPLLKTLHLSSVLFERFEYLVEILSGCPILEELQAEDLSVDNVEWVFIQENSVIVKKFISLLPNLIRVSITKSPSYLMNLVTLLCTEAQILRAELDRIIGNNNQFHNLTNIELIIKHNHRDK